MRIYAIILFFIPLLLLSQNYSEEIKFISSNPFSFSDVINGYDNLEKQEVFGSLVKDAFLEVTHGSKSYHIWMAVLSFVML